jgi:hypothetical protein
MALHGRRQKPSPAARGHRFSTRRAHAAPSVEVARRTHQPREDGHVSNASMMDEKQLAW